MSNSTRTSNGLLALACIMYCWYVEYWNHAAIHTKLKEYHYRRKPYPIHTNSSSSSISTDCKSFPTWDQLLQHFGESIQFSSIPDDLFHICCHCWVFSMHFLNKKKVYASLLQKWKNTLMPAILNAGSAPVLYEHTGFLSFIICWVFFPPSSSCWSCYC